VTLSAGAWESSFSDTNRPAAPITHYPDNVLRKDATIDAAFVIDTKPAPVISDDSAYLAIFAVFPSNKPPRSLIFGHQRTFIPPAGNRGDRREDGESLSEQPIGDFTRWGIRQLLTAE
jgi:hypothetical protein